LHHFPPTWIADQVRNDKFGRTHRFAYTALMSEIERLRRILGSCRTIAVAGLSAQWHRPSFFAAKYMQSHGYRIVPVNPGATEILGERCYPTITAASEALATQGLRIDMVDCFRKSEAIAIGARCLWMQIGVIDEVSAAKARAAGLEVVMDRCVKIEHARLFGGLNWIGVNTGVISAKRPRHLPY
jgi:predicted CoA-binding protein